jgi:hypothetical protein
MTVGVLHILIVAAAGALADIYITYIVVDLGSGLARQPGIPAPLALWRRSAPSFHRAP